MRFIIIILGILVAIPIEGQNSRTATQLAVIDGDNSQRTRNRFEFLLDAFDDMCPREQGAASLGDRLLRVHQLIGGSGRVLTTFNNLYSLTSRVSSISGGEFGPCTELWAAYATARQEGMSDMEARQGIYALYEAIFSPN